MADASAPRAARELLPRLPRTFAPAWNEQLKQWDLLFPAEQRQFAAQVNWLAGLPDADFKRLFAPITVLESRMELPHWNAGTTGMSVRDVGLLARSPNYPAWRTEVEKVFARIDDGVQDSRAIPNARRLVVCVLPDGLPFTTPRVWPELEKSGSALMLKAPFGRMLPEFAAAIATRKRAEWIQDIESTWVFECGAELSSLAESSTATVLSWAVLAAARREFLNRLNTLSRDLKSVDQTHEQLRRVDLRPLTGPAIGGNPRIREFVRALLLSGNGSLVFNNSFIEWGASEALRRVQPQALVAYFGMRPRLKPFSSAVLFEDQTRSNPTPDEDDPQGSLVDAVQLAGYVHQASQRTPAYQGRTLTLLCACGLDRVVVLGSKDIAGGPVDSTGLGSIARDWLAA